MPTANTAWTAIERVSQLKSMAFDHGYAAEANMISEEPPPVWRIETPSGNIVTWTGDPNGMRAGMAGDDKRSFSPGYFSYRSGAAGGDRQF